ncbi:MFS transporter [Caulobacter sp. UNC279MFTsu5.1]|uniref:MFS transporter n=1 Tax=Caulobacter sp. UNC279MFTsu5.1 TaxID=1502775 RepID=UPI000375EFFA|nr:MFS transporter [Caulobacter sp. UNC279MFTsu5.1]SFI86163.1 Fucose permease [Caulobacter sp. UNC279MFTsu5.1]
MSAASPDVRLDDKARGRAFAILFAVLLSSAAGNTALQTVLPAIGRQVGIPDVLISSIFSLSALAWGVMSPVWARMSDRRGRKPMVILGMAGFAVSMLGFGFFILMGLKGLMVPLAVFAGAALSRAIFGLVGSASNPAAQAYVADRTAPADRTNALATMASASGLGTILGPAVAPFLVFPLLTLSGPMFSFALIAIVVLVLVVRGLPETPDEIPERVGDTAHKPRARVRWNDRRIMPFIVYGFLLASAQTVNQQTLGFMVIDKLKISPAQAAAFAGVAMMAGAVASLLAQWGLIRMLRLTPRQLLWLGAGSAAAGNLIVAFSPDYHTLVVGFALCSLGYGFARPGFTAGASLSVGHEEQGAVAGAISAINGASVIIAPVLGVALYKWAHPSPYLMNVAVLAGLVAYALLDPIMRRVGDASAPREARDEAQVVDASSIDASGPH